MKLHGFNNLTKSLGVSLYKIAFIDSPAGKNSYTSDINDKFGSEALSSLLESLASSIGGRILNTAKQDYQPQGASVTLMIADDDSANIKANSIVNHLDKSHLCVHTYPEEYFIDNIAIFRADLEISTCGIIPPLKVINKLLTELEVDLLTIDYRVRGFNQLKSGKKEFIDHEIEMIEQYIAPEHLTSYQATNDNISKLNLFYTTLIKKSLKATSLFQYCTNHYSALESEQLCKTLHEELQAIGNISIL
jgi:S-adenosylmethionine decarboxylase